MAAQFTRRQLLGHSTRLALAAGIGIPLLQACGSEAASSATIPLARMDKPITLPDNKVKAVASGKSPETGTLKLFSYDSYINPDTIAAFESALGVTVEYSTFDTEDKLLAGLTTSSFSYDVVVGATTLGLPKYVVSDLVQPLNREYLPHFSNVLTSLQNPYYDQGSKYSIPYTVYTTGIAYRRDIVDPALFDGEDAWKVLWDPQYKGFVGIIDDAREVLTLAMYYRGLTDTNTADKAILGKAEADAKDLISATNARLDILAYQKIPDGTSHVNQAWSGDMLAGLQYLPEGTSSDVLGYWAPTRTTVANDFSVIPARSERPVLAHAFIDYLLDPANALQNFEYVGYQPAVIDPSPDSLISGELVPTHLTTALVNDDQVNQGYRLDALAPNVQLLWDDAFNRIKAG